MKSGKVFLLFTWPDESDPFGLSPDELEFLKRGKQEVTNRILFFLGDDLPDLFLLIFLHSH